MANRPWQELREEAEEKLKNKDYQALRRLMIDEMQEVDIADFLMDCSRPEAVLLFNLLPEELKWDVFTELPAKSQERLIEAYSDEELAQVIDAFYNDELADLMSELPALIAERVLDNTPKERRGIVNRLLSYPEDSAGAMMTTEYLSLKKDMSVGDAIQRLRGATDEIETIYSCFVIDEKRTLLGVVELSTLLSAQDEQKVGDVMDAITVSCKTETDQEDVALLFDRYDIYTLPVIDSENRLVGIITVDDAMEVLRQEDTEDISKISGVQPTEKPYLQTGIWENARHRILWLLVLMISGLLVGGILSHYEAAFVDLPTLVTFIPMLMGTGGNAGSQSSTIQIRSIALDEIRFSDIPVVLWKELRISIVVGIGLGVVNALRIYFFMGRDIWLALTVSGTMFLTVMAAKLVGASLPWLAKAAHLDPALMAAPLITTIIDALTVIIYFSLALLLIPALR